MTWKPVFGYESIYEVSNAGQVRKIDGTPMNHWNNGKGYRYITLVKDGKKKNHYIHRLVLSSFSSLVEGKPDVNHKDGIKSNNILDNLEWCNKFENMRHAYDNKLVVNPNAKLNERDVLIIRKMWQVGLHREQIAKVFDISFGQISRIVKKRNWNHD